MMGRMGHDCEASHSVRLDELPVFRARQVSAASPGLASSDVHGSSLLRLMSAALSSHIASNGLPDSFARIAALFLPS